MFNVPIVKRFNAHNKGGEVTISIFSRLVEAVSPQD